MRRVRQTHILTVLHVRDFLTGLVPLTLNLTILHPQNAHTMFPQWITSCGMTHLRNSDIFIASTALQHNIGKIPEGGECTNYDELRCMRTISQFRLKNVEFLYLILCNQKLQNAAPCHGINKLHYWNRNKIRNVCRLPNYLFRVIITISAQLNISTSLFNSVFSLLPPCNLATLQLIHQLLSYLPICLLWQ